MRGYPDTGPMYVPGSDEGLEHEGDPSTDPLRHALALLRQAYHIYPSDRVKIAECGRVISAILASESG